MNFENKLDKAITAAFKIKAYYPEDHSLEVTEGPASSEILSERHKTDLKRYLKGVTLLAGESYVEDDPSQTYNVAIVHDAGGYTPGGAIAVEGSYMNADALLQAAFEDLEEHERNANPEYWEEYERENPGYTASEGWDGDIWLNVDGSTLANLIRSDERLAKFVSIIQ